MTSTDSRSRRTSARAYVSASIAIALGFVSAGVAVPALADSEGVSHSPQHVWVDPTQRNVDGDYEFSFIVHMPEVTEFAVMSGTAPDFTTGDTHCQAPEPVDGDELRCVGEGDAIPGEYTVGLELRIESGILHTWSVPLTVCPLTGCSDLFSFTVSPEPIVIWAGTTVETHIGGTYNFNVLWNFGEIKFVDDLADAQGNPAPGLYDPLSEPAKNGAQFGYRGYFTQPGLYTSTVIVIDEFGGEHEADFTVRVCTPETCADLLALPDTGVDAVAIAAGAAFAVLAVGAGAFMLIVRRRKS